MDIKERREQLREGLAIRHHTTERSLARILDENSPINYQWEDLTGTQREHYRKRADIDIVFLSSLGLVFKVEGELPKEEHLPNKQAVPSIAEKPFSLGQRRMRTRMLKAGYTKTEPLEER